MLELTGKNRSELNEAVGRGGQVIRALWDSPHFLQTVIDALPDAITVIDRDFRVVMANETAKRVAGGKDGRTGCLRCYELSHHRESPCKVDEDLCPLRIVASTKVATTVVHTHYDSEGRELFVEITAAPIFDESGDVQLIVESSRDITERKRAGRFLEITNRHSEMKPMLDEFAAELRTFTRCNVAGIRLVDESGNISSCPLSSLSESSATSQGPPCVSGSPCVCLQVINGETDAKPPYCTPGGSICLDCKTYRLVEFADRTTEHMRGQCDGCEYGTVALVPIRLGKRVIGLIYVADPKHNAISRQMVEALERVGLEFGTAIQRVEAEEALRSAHDQLEGRVERRTADLTRANQALQDEIAERTRLEREILKISSQEHQSIGQELHDGVGQELTGLSYLATSLHQKLRAKELGEAETAAELSQGIPRVLGQLRTIVKGLVPLEIDADDLKPALEALTTRVEEQLDIVCRCEADRRARVGDSDAAIQMYRIAQEAVNNAIRHGRAGKIVVSLKPKRGRIELAVCDNGVGIPADTESAVGCGLRIMRYRARVIGGTLTVQRVAEGGTLVSCVIPQE